MHQAHLQNHEHQLEMKMMQMNSILGENLEGLQQREIHDLLYNPLRNTLLRHEGEDIRQLFYHQRHRRHDRRTVDKLLHGTPLDPLLRSRHVKQTVWPGAPGGRHIIHVHRIVHSACRLGRGDASGSSPQSSTRNPPPRPWPSSVPIGLSGVVTWPGPQRSTTSAVVAASDAEQRSTWTAS